MYRIINEDNSFVNEYPASKLYDMISDKEKEYIQLFKKEIDKIAQEEGLDKITVSLSYDEDVMEKAFEIKDNNGFTFYELEEKKNRIRDHMAEICKNNKELYEFYMNSYIITQMEY